MSASVCTSERVGGGRGFTLIELMVAMVVLTLGLFSIIHLQVVTVRGHAYARERNEAAIRCWRQQEWPRIKKSPPQAL